MNQLLGVPPQPGNRSQEGDPWKISKQSKTLQALALGRYKDSG